MQTAFIGKLMELAEKDERIVYVVGDSGTDYDELFRRSYPDRYFNFGISEQQIVAAAAGLALTGKKPFVFDNGSFLAYRAFEFIRDDVCFQNTDVKIVGMGSGLSISQLGPTHHTTEDVAVLRSLPHLTLFAPASPAQAAACTSLAAEITGPVYIKLGVSREKEFFQENAAVRRGGSDRLYQGHDVTVFSAGTVLEESESAVRLLRDQGVDAGLVNAYSLKPFDAETFFEVAESSALLVSVEEHSIYGGLGSIMAELAADRGLGVPVKRIGLEDVFAVGYGKHGDVKKENGLGADTIAEKIIKWLR